jgi:hypothetical protein
MFLIILIKSLIIGGLVGVGVGAGAARMFHAPTTQGMGAFRTLGELNSCEGDPASHFSLAWASSSTPGPLPSRQAPSLRTLTTALSPTGGGGADD